MTTLIYPIIAVLVLVLLCLISWLLRPVKIYTGFVTLFSGRQLRYTIYARSHVTARLILRRLSRPKGLDSKHQPHSLNIVAGLDDAGELV